MEGKRFLIQVDPSGKEEVYYCVPLEDVFLGVYFEGRVFEVDLPPSYLDTLSKIKINRWELGDNGDEKGDILAQKISKLLNVRNPKIKQIAEPEKTIDLNLLSDKKIYFEDEYCTFFSPDDIREEYILGVYRYWDGSNWNEIHVPMKDAITVTFDEEQEVEIEGDRFMRTFCYPIKEINGKKEKNLHLIVTFFSFQGDLPVAKIISHHNKD